MANFFDQFDAPPASNYFDQFDEPKAERPTALAASNEGVLQGITLGFGDELMAGIFTPIEMAARAIRGEDWSPGASYDAALERERGALKAAEEAHPVATGAGTLAGGLVTGGGLAGVGAGARAAQAGGGLGKVALGSAADGLALGAATGFGSGEGGAGERAKSAGTGALYGGILGGAAPYVVAGGAAAARPVFAPILSRMNPQGYADDALGTVLRRSGMTPQQVEAALADASADGQGVFTVADALGNSGQRMLSTVARSPSEGRQAVVEALQSRQAGQGRRITTALEEGFAAPDTAAERALSLKAARDLAADEGYGAARASARGVDVTGAVKKIDETLQPGISRLASPQTNIADDTVEGALRRARRMLTDGRSNASDFSVVLRAKQDIDDMIGAATRAGANNRARVLTQIKSELDRALSAASPEYAAARNAFRQGSQEIEAVDIGKNAAQRGRPEDNIARFAKMSPTERAAFRSGYADNLIEGTQSAAMGSNKVRPLINDATGAEFPVFAARGKADQLGNRLAREQRMFETNQAALGGSKTADNLADMADMGQWDPSIVMNLVQGRVTTAATQAVMRALNEAKGMPPAVIDLIGKTLMESRPDVARLLLMQAQRPRALSANAKAVAAAIGASGGAAMGGRAY